MNFKDLMTKLQSIEENAPPIAPVHTDKPGQEEGIEIIGGPMGLPGMAGHPEAPKQPDNVSMNVTLNGTGSGGVRNLMNILKDIEDGKDGHDHDALFGEPHGGDAEEPIMGDMIAHMAHEEEMDEVFDDDKEVWGNSAHGDSGHHTHGVDAVTFSGDDMNSKGKVSPLARAPGTNALQHPMHESLVDKLTAMYETIKETAHHEDDEEKKIRHLMRKYGWSRQEALEYYHYEEHDPTDYEDMEESAKWRDPKYKGQLFTQKKGDSDDYDSIDYGYGIKERPKKDPGQKRSTFDRDTVWTDPLDTRSNLPKNHNDPESWGYGSISSKGDSKGKLTADRRKRMKNDIQGSLGQHHTPNLPEQMNESKESQLYENDLEKALDSTAGGFTGWNHMQGKSYENYGPYKHHVRTAVKNGADVYHYDDGEGGYDATGEVVYDKNNGIYYAVINKEPSTHKSLGSLMNLIRNEIGENGRRHDANNQHRSDSLDREPFDPEQHLYKTDRAGKKGMLNKGRINDLTSPYRRKITGPQGVLPEQMNESKELNDIIALTKYLKG